MSVLRCNERVLSGGEDRCRVGLAGVSSPSGPHPIAKLFFLCRLGDRLGVRSHANERAGRVSVTSQHFSSVERYDHIENRMNIARSFSGNSLLDHLEVAEYKLIESGLSEKFLERDTVIHDPGDRMDVVYFPNGAILSVITLMEDGRGVESSTIGRESAHGVLAAFGSHKAHNRVICQIPGQSFMLPTARLKEAAAKSPTLADHLIRHVQGNTAQVEQSVACNALHSVEERLCRWILMSADRGDGKIVSLTQEYLAIMLGVQRTTVTQAARTLQAAGLINYARGAIEIVNRAGLEDTVCECYGVVRQKFDLLLGLSRPPAARVPQSDVA
jgi:CRP-like cAMP-binding protein